MTEPNAPTPTPISSAAAPPIPAKPEAAKVETAKVETAKAGPATMGAAPGAAKVEPAKPAVAAQPVSTHSPRSALAVFTAFGFLLLFGAGYYMWQRVESLDQPPGVDPARVVALEGQLRTLQTRLAALEAKPSSPPAASAPASAPGIDLKPLEARIASLEQRPAPAPAPAAPPPDNGPLLAKIGALETRLAASEAQANQATARATTLARLQAAAAALEAAKPLGAIPDATPALARFATAAPPSEAALRLAFPDAARRAADASHPAKPEQGTGERILQQIESLVTLRAGTKVLVGPPASFLLGNARQRLDAGDLAGAVAALKGLDTAAAAAMADWTGPAQALLDARAALASAMAAAAGRA